MASNQVEEESQPPAEESEVEESESKAGKPNGTQVTRSYMYLDAVGASMMYEKDGNWVLEKMPPLERKKAKTDGEDEDEDENGGACNKTLVSGLLALDTITGQETVPCNLCDVERSDSNGNEIAPVWNWLYTTMNSIIEKVKEYKRDMEQRDVSCGENYRPPGQKLVSTKGTQSSVNMDR